VLAPALARRGAFRLDAMVLTHFDADHCQGLLDLTHVLRVRDVWTAPGWERSPCAQELRARAARRSGVVQRGYRLDYGAWTLGVLGPDLSAFEPPADDNDASVVLDARAAGARVLLLGDLGAEGERWLAFRDGGALRAEVLKVAHHGSSSSTTRRLLDEVRPRLSLISAARQDSFGHPAPATLERLRRAGSQVLRTDLDGEIEISWRAGRRRVARPGPIDVARIRGETD
jgi:competence protein ComEC